MRVDVLSLSDYAATRLDAKRTKGRVHSVYRSSLNIECDGFLLHVGSDDKPLSCLGATVGAREASVLANMLEPGNVVQCRNGLMRLYGVDGVAELDLFSAPVQGLSVPLSSCSPDNEVDIALCRELGELELPARIGLPWDERSGRSLAGLARLSATCRSVWEAQRDLQDVSRRRIEATYRDARDSIEYLLGRGLGLTPSGDDVLCGFGCGLCYQWRRPSFGFDAWSFYSRAVLDLLPGKTTAISEEYLRAMCAGYANQQFIEVLRAMETGDSEAIRSSLTRVLAIGHTSGADSLLGFGASFGCICI